LNPGKQKGRGGEAVDFPPDSFGGFDGWKGNSEISRYLSPLSDVIFFVFIAAGGVFKLVSRIRYFRYAPISLDINAV